jgi:hypothetical protein
VNSRGEPAAGATVLVYVEYLSFHEPTLASTTTDGQGRFRLPWPPLASPGRGLTANGNRSHLFSYRQESALAVGRTFDRSNRLVLPEAAPRAVTVQRADGKPLAGVKLMPRLIHVFNGPIAEIPVSLAAQLAATTGPDGKATLTSLAARDELMAVRVAADSLAEQDIVLVDRTASATRTGPVIVTIQATSRISGRIVDEQDRGVSGQAVEVWTLGSSLNPCPVGFAGGPVRTGPDGSFQTPQTLRAGSTFRVVVRAPGKDVILGGWIRLEPKPADLPAMVLGELRTLRGRVVDRTGKPVAGAEVLQRGDGPEPTSARTDANGRFSLGGFRSRPAILFARHEGFRFHGQLVRPLHDDATIALTRRDEPPPRVMKPVPPPELPADSRAIARRLIEPVLEMALRRKDAEAAVNVLVNLAAVDPGAALEKLDSANLADPQARMRVRLAVIQNLARTDPEEAAGLAEAIPDADLAAYSLLNIVKALPADRRPMKLDLLDRALLKARAATDVGARLRHTAGVARWWCDLGEVEKARKLLAETLPVGSQYAKKTDVRRGFFAASLARFDLPAAMALASDLSERHKDRVRCLMASQLAGTNPAESERLWNEAKGSVYSEMLEVCWRLASSDPVRARRIAAKAAERGDPNYYIVLALGLAPRDKAAARAALQEGIDWVDRRMDDPLSDFRVGGFLRTALEVVDRIDPALAADVFWRYLATRPSSINPRDPIGPYSGLVLERVAVYDRYLARLLFESIRARKPAAEGRELAESLLEFDAWAFLDPAAAIAAAEKLPIDPDRLDRSSGARSQVAAALARRGRYRPSGYLDFLPRP